MTEVLGQFGHHPDPATDAEIEASRLQGDLQVAHAGLLRALDFKAVSPEGLHILDQIRGALHASGYTGPLGERGTPTHVSACGRRWSAQHEAPPPKDPQHDR